MGILRVNTLSMRGGCFLRSRAPERAARSAVLFPGGWINLFGASMGFQCLYISQILGSSCCPLVVNQVIDRRNTYFDPLDVHGQRPLICFLKLKSGCRCNEVDSPGRNPDLKYGPILLKVFPGQVVQGSAKRRNARSTASAFRGDGLIQMSMSIVARGKPWAASA